MPLPERRSKQQRDLPQKSQHQKACISSHASVSNTTERQHIDVSSTAIPSNNNAIQKDLTPVMAMALKQNISNEYENKKHPTNLRNNTQKDLTPEMATASISTINNDDHIDSPNSNTIQNKSPDITMVSKSGTTKLHDNNKSSTNISTITDKASTSFVDTPNLKT